MVFFRPSKGQAQLVFMARVIGVEVRRIAEIMKKISRRKLVKTFEDLKTSVIFSAILRHQNKRAVLTYLAIFS